MPDDAVRRAHYHERQYLGAQLMTLEQDYHRDLRRRLNLGHHTQGIVVGLGLHITDDPNQLWLYPGLAVDVYGREILVTRPQSFDATQFAETSSAAPVTVPIYIGYDWGAAGGPGAAQCADPSQYEVTEETFVLRKGRPDPQHGQITVDGRDAETEPDRLADESYPYQELPLDTEEPTAWVYLGAVRIANQQFTAVDLSGRAWAGVVAGAVHAPSDKLLLHPRLDPPAGSDFQTDFATVHGALKVDYDLNAGTNLYLTGGSGSVQFQPRDSTDPQAFSLSRTDQATLELGIGTVKPGDKAPASFAIVSNAVPLLTVDSDQTTTFGAGRVVIAKDVPIVGIGDLVERSPGRYRWQDQSGSPTDRMSLDGSDLTVAGNLAVGGTAVDLQAAATAPPAWIRWNGLNALGFDPAAKDVEVGPDARTAQAIGLAVSGDLTVGGNVAVSGTLIDLVAPATTWVRSNGVRQNALGFDPSGPAVKLGDGWRLEAGEVQATGLRVSGTSVDLTAPVPTWITSNGGDALGFDPSGPAVRLGSGWRLEAGEVQASGLTVSGDVVANRVMTSGGASVIDVVVGQRQAFTGSATIKVTTRLTTAVRARLIASIVKVSVTNVNILIGSAWSADLASPVDGIPVLGTNDWTFTLAGSVNNASVDIAWVAVFYPY